LGLAGGIFSARAQGENHCSGDGGDGCSAHRLMFADRGAYGISLARLTV
jgi:hypothetical protein